MCTRQLYDIYANFDEHNIVVYQAFNSGIADAALEAQRFVSPFKFERMTWIKPSFNWMLYRSDCGRSSNQERVLAIQISRSGFETILSQAAASNFDQSNCKDHDEWKKALVSSPVRIQWDPERDDRLQKMNDVRSLQIGLKGEVVREYSDNWITAISDVTQKARKAAELLNEGKEIGSLRNEAQYPLPEPIRKLITPE